MLHLALIALSDLSSSTSCYIILHRTSMFLLSRWSKLHVCFHVQIPQGEEFSYGHIGAHGISNNVSYAGSDYAMASLVAVYL